jgi:protein-tyrosine phosphatase
VSVIGWIRRLTGGRTGGGIVLGERDCHCHVIPGVDDGSRDMKESLAMLRLLAADGVRRVIATSHIYPGRFPNEPENLREGLLRVESERQAAGIDIELELGAEHWLDESLLARIEAGRVIAFGPEKYVLFETTTGGHAPPILLDVVHALVERGYTPLMAHVERYAYLRDDEQGLELCEDLRAAGARFQVNRTVGRANVPGEGSRGRFLQRLIDQEWIDEVGSDLHRPTPEGRPHTMPS